MARGRMVSKSISLDEKVDSLSNDTARLLFTWLIPHLDVEGRMYGDARLFISIVAPRRHYSLQKVEKYLTELESHGLILRYNVDGNTYLCEPSFVKHQTGLRKDREAQSQIPPPPPELLRSKDGVKTELLPPKLRLSLSKVKLREVEGATTAFDTYKEKLRQKYPELSVDDEWESCQIWYRDNKKQIKSPSLALRNWLEKARIKQGNSGGVHQAEPVDETDRMMGMEVE